MTFTQSTSEEFESFLAVDLRQLKALMTDPRLHFDVN